MQSSSVATTNGTNTTINYSKRNDSKRIILSDIWKVLDEEIGGSIPKHLKQLLTCAGYDSITVLEYLNADEIIEIENYGKNKFLFDLKDEDEIIEFLNMCPDNNPKNFQLKRGHKLLLECLVRRIHVKGVDFFIEQLRILNKSNLSTKLPTTFRQCRSEVKYSRKRLKLDVQNAIINLDDDSGSQFEPMVTIHQKRLIHINNKDGGKSQDTKYINDPLKSDLSPISQQSPATDYKYEKLAEQAENLKKLANRWIERKLICEDVSKYLVTNTKVMIAKNGALEGVIQCACGSFIKVQHDIRWGLYRWTISNFSRHVTKHELVLPLTA